MPADSPADIFDLGVQHSFLIFVLLFWWQQVVRSYAEEFGYDRYLNVGHKALASLDPLYRVFVDIKTGQLQAVGELTLRYTELFAQP